MEIKLCEQCGYLKGYFEKTNICPVCKNHSFITREDLTTEHLVKISKMSIEEEEQFKINYLGHDFDPELKQKRIKFDERRNQILKEKYDKIEVKPKITCPYCQSTDTKKISNTSKAVHTAVFGLWSMGRNAKNYHCNKCKSDF